MAGTPTKRRASRTRLYVPIAVLAVLALVWSGAWFLIRDEVVGGLDAWLRMEAAAGRIWTCDDRRVQGFPFRIELRCASLSLATPEAAASLGAVTVLTQIYDKGRIIAEASGPLVVQSNASHLEASWRLLQASVATKGGIPQRVSVVVDEPKARVALAEATPFDLSSRHSEMHLRPNPTDATSADVAVNLAGAIVPGMDLLVGGAEPADLDLVSRVTRVYDLPLQPGLLGLDRWREAGGRIELSRFSLQKGPRRLEATGVFSIDEAHRPDGELRPAALGLEGLLGRIAGGRSGGILGALLGAAQPEIRQAPPDGSPNPSGPPLKSLPTIRLQAGRAFLGPLPIPGVRLPALY